MNWDAFGAIAELLGATGVIASLVYLARQIRISTRTERARALQDLLNQNLALNAKIAADAELFDRAYAGETFEGPEAVRWMAAQNIGLRFQWNAWELYRSGMIDDERWKAIASPMARIFELPAMKQYWEEAFALYPAGFRAAIEAQVSAGP